MADAGAYLVRNLTHEGRLYEAGTKVSEVPNLTPEQKDRLERLGVTGTKKEAEADEG